MNATPPGPSLRLDRSLATHQRTTRPASIGSARRRRHLLAPLPAVRSFFFLLHHHIYWVFVAFLVGLPGSVCLSVGLISFSFFFSSNINRNRHSLCVISPPPSSLFGSLCTRIILLLIVNSECASQPIHREKEKKKEIQRQNQDNRLSSETRRKKEEEEEEEEEEESDCESSYYLLNARLVFIFSTGAGIGP